MTRVFDASAVLAAVFDEPGGEKVAEFWADGENLISSVNYAEVVSKLNDRGLSNLQVSIVLEGVPLKILDFDQASALATGLMRKATRELGLSLGDRACLATGRIQGAEIITAERLWKILRGYSIKLIH